MNNLSSFFSEIMLILEAIFVFSIIIWIILGSKNDNKNADTILNEVKKKRQRAERLGLPNLINDIYEKVKYFSSNSDYMPSIIKNCICIDSKIIIELNNSKYIFNYSEQKTTRFDDRGYYKNANLELILNEDKIFSLNITQDIIWDNSLVDYYKGNLHFTINAFKEGNWVKDFRELKKQIDIASKVRLEKQAEKQKMDHIKQLKQLKSDFDIK